MALPGPLTIKGIMPTRGLLARRRLGNVQDLRPDTLDVNHLPSWLRTNRLAFRLICPRSHTGHFTFWAR